MDEEELKPCPFCGGPAELNYRYEDFSPDSVYVYCKYCRAQATLFSCRRDDIESRAKAERNAIKMWNRRIELEE